MDNSDRVLPEKVYTAMNDGIGACVGARRLSEQADADEAACRSICDAESSCAAIEI
eukprot:SAG31_NODE_33415_length_344_cov_0.636735_1_plen_55_part_01